MVHAGRRTARALCLLCLALLLLAQDAHSSRKLLLQERQGHGHGHGVGNGTTTTQEPSREKGESTGANNDGQLQFDSAKWEELHTDYIYTQDVKKP
ncbi:phytosulfokines 1-like [Oryza brachyantha]|uniref:Phytosulfokine-alpha n=1 Tax=Oryza brachyantha TaxID=4533 RepID=J3MG21_ORYBR|nr:phytosulfokines 1-like [Oryza brachyantha]